MNLSNPSGSCMEMSVPQKPASNIEAQVLSTYPGERGPS